MRAGLTKILKEKEEMMRIEEGSSKEASKLESSEEE